MRPERPRSTAFDTVIDAAGEGRIARSWRLTKTGFAVARGDRAVMALSVLGAVFVLVGVLAGIWLVDVRADHGLGAFTIAAIALVYLALSLFGTFIGTAQAAAANAALDERPIAIGQALGIAWTRLPQVVAWALLATGVGLLIHEVVARVPLGGRIAAWFLGAAWGVVTFFAVPLIAIERCSAARCARRSAELVRERWGEGVTGQLVIGAWGVIVCLPLGVLVGLGLAVGSATGIALAAVSGLAVIAVIAVQNAAGQVFRVALYRYALAHRATVFAEADLAQPFAPKRRGLISRLRS
jgi:fumarate reductase subunit D